MEENLGKAGYEQGNMKPHVEDYQLPKDAYSQMAYGNTLNYISRQDESQKKAAKQIKNQAYKGRYS